VLPLRDDIPSQRFPALTLVLIAANVAMFLFEAAQGPEIERFLFTWGFVPARYMDAGIASRFTLRELAAPFLTSMFLHGGWMHLIGNMWILWIFGDNVEDRLGRLGFLGLYLVGGCAATVVHLITNAHSAVPTIGASGASGAVAAVMGAYFRLYPHARVHTVIPPFLWGPVFELPAVVFLGLWFLLQFFNGTLSLVGSPERAGGIAWWAHIGGFAFGLIVALFVTGKRPRRRSEWDEDDAWRE
jgi:membrane associated rhomboid family serine protease